MVSYAIVLTAILFIIAVSMMRTASAVSAEGLCRNTKIDLIYHKMKCGAFHLGGFILVSGAITAVLAVCRDSLTAALSARFVEFMRKTANLFFGTRSLFGALNLVCIFVTMIIFANCALTFALLAACYFVAVFKSACGKVLSEIEALYSCPNFSESNLYLKLKQLRN